MSTEVAAKQNAFQSQTDIESQHVNVAFQNPKVYNHLHVLSVLRRKTTSTAVVSIRIQLTG